MQKMKGPTKDKQMDPTIQTTLEKGKDSQQEQWRVPQMDQRMDHHWELLT
jgi:hypothetical protein